MTKKNNDFFYSHFLINPSYKHLYSQGVQVIVLVVVVWVKEQPNIYIKEDKKEGKHSPFVVLDRRLQVSSFWPSKNLVNFGIQAKRNNQTPNLNGILRAYRTHEHKARAQQPSEIMQHILYYANIRNFHIKRSLHGNPIFYFPFFLFFSIH